ncbi:acyl-CoA thioesterase [Pseudomonas sp. PB101]|uniref:acyl-CoA thioesterase n=1 Tax=Pseudomonas sp. PB101 TaxID=2495428 RepID=UPI0013666EDF|nr:thioesterase family protein [Pseudomonas sp. PB101]MVW86149.1 thioesterase family protein [Pseudomonas sp. PB101]
MNFSALIDASRLPHRPLMIPASWSQGRAAFGGVVVALAHEAMRQFVPRDRSLRSLSLTFIGPVAVDQPLFFETEVLREGSAVTQLHCRVVQSEQTVTSVQACFGSARSSALALPAEPMPGLPALETCEPLPLLPDVAPRYLQHFDIRWGYGGMPFSGASSRSTGGWIRLKDAPLDATLSETQLLAMLDAWPPAVLSQHRALAQGSSLTWSVEFAQPLINLPADTWCVMHASTDYALEGYSACSTTLHTPDGKLLALSRQTVVVFG